MTPLRLSTCVPLTVAAILSAAAPSAAARSGPDATFATPPEVRVLLAGSTTTVRNDAARGLQRRRLAGEKAPASLNAIVLMCDFADSLLLGRFGQVSGDFPPPAQTDRYYAAHDDLFFSHLLGDVADYFGAVSGGRLAINTTVHPRAINLPQPMAFYGNHPQEGEQSVLMAAAVIDSLDEEIDFTAYDTVLLVHAGAGEETDILSDSPEQIFSTYLDPDDFRAAFEDSLIDQPYLPASGFPPDQGIDRVLILPETEQQDPFGSFGGGFGSLGVYCFEVGLHLGMLSLSDFTPGGRPDSQGVGQYGLMGYGLFVGLGFIPPQPCAYNRLLMGWLDPYEADVSALDTWMLTPADDPTLATAGARVNITGQEFWLLEYRLQDPNGDRRFTFSGDLNGNGLPDFFDADSDAGDGTPTGLYDPAADTRERLTDAEWDFSMSENSARGLGELAAGSGVFIWHVDEGVVEDVFHAPSNLFNADPFHKAVDLEEADGIQDLDSNEPSAFLLGGDDDSFRGEDASRFGPDTLPATDTAAGVATGIVFRDFSPVVRDSAAYEVVVGDIRYPGYDYADTMFFELFTEFSTPTNRRPDARRDLPSGTDLRGAHLMVGDLDGSGATQEIVVAGAAGEIFALDGGLDEFFDHDGDPATLEPLVVGTRGGVGVVWNQPAALGDIDGDDEPEIVLTGPTGLYAFHVDGSPVRSGLPGDLGLYAELTRCRQPPLLLPVTPDTVPGHPRAQVTAVVLAEEAGETRLMAYRGPDATETRDTSLGAGSPASPAVSLEDRYLLVALADTAAGQHRLAVTRRSAVGIPEEPETVAFSLAARPGPWPPLVQLVPGSSPEDPVYAVTVVDVDGRGETIFFDGDREAVGAPQVWSAQVVVSGPLAPGGAFFTGGDLGRVGQAGDWLTGWPRSPRPAASAGAGTPLVANLVDASSELDQYIFQERDGRVFAAGHQGEPVAGWPLAGPARSAGTPALGPLAGAPEMDLVAAGAFARVEGQSADGDSLRTRWMSTLVVWNDVVAGEPAWPMWGGSPWRDGRYDLESVVGASGVAEGPGIVIGSHICYPSPLTRGPLSVRAQVRAAGRARATVYNLEGEAVASSAWRAVPAAEPFVIEMPLEVAVSGMYLCRLVVEHDGGGRDQNVVTFAIAR